MDMIKTPMGKLFRHYLTASLGSAVIMTIYAFVDAVAVGQAEGPAGAAVMAVISPLFGIYVFLSLVFGIGGSVLMSAARGEGQREEGDRWYSASMLLMGAVTLVFWALLAAFHKPVMRFFGATDELYPLLMRYAWWLIAFAPMVVGAVFLACFVRNDGAPRLAMTAVLVGGAFNIFGDWFLVFPLGMGITGAGLATIGSNAIQTVILCAYIFGKRSGLRLVKPGGLWDRMKAIVSIGFGAGMLDLANVFLFALLNNQIIRYGGVNYLAVFGAIGTAATLFQSLFAGVGQALQPIASTNHGASEFGRVRSVLSRALAAALGMSAVFFLLCQCFPRPIVRLFMDATPEVVGIAGEVIRPYGFTFLFMSVNIVITYYLQSTLHGRWSTAVSLLRGLFLSGAFILVFPLVFGLNGVWWAVPAAEALVAALALYLVFGDKNVRRG